MEREYSALHDSFTLSRRLPGPPGQIFAAWATPDLKRRWFVDSDGPGWDCLDYGLDFRPGGREHGRFRKDGHEIHENETVYLDIAPDRRIVFAYTMSLDGQRISASLATVTFTPVGGETDLDLTEQAVFLDGLDTLASRRKGWTWLLDQLAAEMARLV